MAVKKTTKKTSAKRSAKKTPSKSSIAERTRAINDRALDDKAFIGKSVVDYSKYPKCIRKDCGEKYDPNTPELKNNPGYCSIRCGHIDLVGDVKVWEPSSAPAKATGKPQEPHKESGGKIVPKALSKTVLEPPKPSYVPSELQGKAIGLAEPRSSTQVQTIDAKTGEVVDNPAELVLVDDVERYYSHSTIRSLASCSAQVYYRKTGVKGTPAFALERGSTAHAALEVFQKTGDPTKAMKSFEDNWKLLVLDNAAKMKPSDQEKVRLGYEETKRMVTEFIIENGDVIVGRPDLNKAEVEFSIIVNLNVAGGSIKRRIFGKLDWVKFSADGKHYTILDYKTSGQAPPDNELDRDTQFAIYQLAGTELYGFPPDKMVFYYLKGQHICGGRFSKEHPRPTTAAGMEKCLQFAFDIPIKTPEAIQAMIDTYYAPTIFANEIGLITKNLSDARKCVSMCSFKEHCDGVTSLPPPRFVRLAP